MHPTTTSAQANKTVRSFRFSIVTLLAALGCSIGTVSAKVIHRIDHPSALAVEFSSDNRFIATLGLHEQPADLTRPEQVDELVVWSADKWQELHQQSGVRRFTISPKGNYLAALCVAGEEQYEIVVWETETWKRVDQRPAGIQFQRWLHLHRYSESSRFARRSRPLYFSPDERFLACKGEEKLMVYDLSATPFQSVMERACPPGSLAFSNDSRLIGLPPGRVLEILSGKQLETTPVYPIYGGEASMEVDLAFHCNDAMLLGMTCSISSGNTANRFIAHQVSGRPSWRLTGRDCILKERGYASRVLVPLKKNRVLICAGQVIAYDCSADGDLLRRSVARIAGTNRYAHCQFAVSHNGDTFAISSAASGGLGGQIWGRAAIEVFDVHSKMPRLTIGPATVLRPQFNGNRQHDYELRVKQKSLFGMLLRRGALALSPDGSRLALARPDLGVVEIREVPESKDPGD